MARINLIRIQKGGNTTLLIVIALSITIWVTAQEPKLMLPTHPSMGVSRFFSYSPDGKYFYLISGPTLLLYDAATVKLLRNIKISDQFSTDACYSPDGKFIIAVQANEATAWDPKTETAIYTLKGHTGKIKNVSYSSDSKYLLTSSGDSTAKIWDGRTGKLVHTLLHSGSLELAVFSPDNKYILTSSKDSTVKIWDCSTGKLVKATQRQNHIISFATFSPDGSRIITNSQDSAIVVYDAKSGELIFRIKTNAKVNYVRYSPQGKYFYTSQYDSVRIWQASSGMLFKTYGIPPDRIAADKFLRKAAFSDNERYFFYGSSYKVRIADLERDENWFWDRSSYDYNALSVKPHTNTFMIGDGNGAFDIVNADLLERVYQNVQHAFWVQNILIDSNGSRIISSHYNGVSPGNCIKVTDINTNKMLYGFNEEDRGLVLINQSSNGKYVLSCDYFNKGVKIWNVLTGKKNFTIDTSSFVRLTSFSPDDKYIVTSDGESSVRIYRSDSGQLVRKLESKLFRFCIFSPSGKYIITTAKDSTIQLWDWITDSLFKTIRHPTQIKQILITPDEKFLYSTDFGSNIYLWDMESGRLENKISVSSNVATLFYNVKGNYLLTGFEDGTCAAWDISGKELFRLVGHSGWVNSIAVGKDRFIFTGSADNTIKKWDPKSLECISTFSPIDSIDYYTYLPSKYYFATPNATKLLHYATADLKVISFEQLDLKYNRPDKVLNAIGNLDTALILSYRRAWEKRIRKLGIDTSTFRDGFSVPEADFINRDALKVEQKSEKLALHIQGRDNNYQLDRFNIWVNEIPVYGQRGTSLRNKKINQFDSIITINLSQGENVIETSVTNVNGTESYRMPLLLNYIPTITKKEQIYFIGIGIDQFNDSNYNLKYSTKDIRDLSIKLREKFGDDVIIESLFNEDVTINNIRALKQKLRRTSVNDKVIISYSGHGMLSKDFDYYLSTYAVNFDKPEEYGLPYEELENLLDSIPARKKLLLIDACHSGEVDKEDLHAINSLDSSKIKRGLKPVAYKNDGHMGLKNSFELMQNLFVNVGKSTGAIIISAAAGTQFALEGVDNLPNGVFTYSILEAMNKFPEMKISELKKFVSERVVELTRGLQMPTSRSEPIAVDWEIWKVKR